MRTVAPRIPGCEEITIAEEQLDYAPVTAALVVSDAGTRTDRVVRWTFTRKERLRIYAGEDLYFGTMASIPLCPHYMQVGFP